MRRVCGELALCVRTLRKFEGVDPALLVRVVAEAAEEVVANAPVRSLTERAPQADLELLVSDVVADARDQRRQEGRPA